MGKFMADPVPDAQLDKMATSINQTICSAEPANYAGIAAVTLAASVLTAGDGNGDYTIANGDASGRKLTVAQQTGVSITADGDATHVVYDDGSTLLFGTTCTTQTLTNGGTLTVPAHDFEIADPV